MLLAFYSLFAGMYDGFDSGPVAPWLLEPGAWEYSLAGDLRWGVAGGWELSTGGITSLVSPELVATRSLLDGPVSVAVSAGLGVPTPGLRLSQSTVLASDETIPWMLVGALGGSAGWRGGPWSAWGGLQVRGALPMGPSTFESADAPWLDPLLLPVTRGWSLGGRLGMGWRPSGAWSLDVDEWAFVPGPVAWEQRALLRWHGPHLLAGAGVATTSQGYPYGRQWNVAPVVDLGASW